MQFRPYTLGMDAMVFGKNLKHWREQAGLSKKELAARAEIDASMMTRYEKGEVASPGTDRLARLADALTRELGRLVTVDDLIQQSPATEPRESELVREFRDLSARVRELEADYDVEVYPRGAVGSAGGRTFANDDVVYLVRSRRLSRLPGGRQPLEVVGDCLAPDIKSGQIVFVQPDISWRPRQIVAVRVNGGVQVKRLKEHVNGVLVLLSNDGELHISDNDATIVGVVVAAQQEFDW